MQNSNWHKDTKAEGGGNTGAEQQAHSPQIAAIWSGVYPRSSREKGVIMEGSFSFLKNTMVWKQLNYPGGGRKEERKGKAAKDGKKLILELFILLHWQIIPYFTSC